MTVTSCFADVLLIIATTALALHFTLQRGLWFAQHDKPFREAILGLVIPDTEGRRQRRATSPTIVYIAPSPVQQRSTGRLEVVIYVRLADGQPYNGSVLADLVTNNQQQVSQKVMVGSIGYAVSSDHITILVG